MTTFTADSIAPAAGMCALPRLIQHERLQVAYLQVDSLPSDGVHRVTLHSQISVDLDSDGNLVGIEIQGRGW